MEIHSKNIMHKANTDHSNKSSSLKQYKGLIKLENYAQNTNKSYNIHITLKTFCQMVSWPVNAKGKLTPWRAIQSISFSHLSQSHQTKESVENLNWLIIFEKKKHNWGIFKMI